MMLRWLATVAQAGQPAGTDVRVIVIAALCSAAVTTLGAVVVRFLERRKSSASAGRDEAEAKKLDAEAESLAVRTMQDALVVANAELVAIRQDMVAVHGKVEQANAKAADALSAEARCLQRLGEMDLSLSETRTQLNALRRRLADAATGEGES